MGFTSACDSLGSIWMAPRLTLYPEKSFTHCYIFRNAVGAVIVGIAPVVGGIPLVVV